MKKLVITALLATAYVASPANAKVRAAKCNIPTQAQVGALFGDFNSAWATKNPDTVTSMFAMDAVLLATVSNKPRLNHADIRDYFETFLKSSPVGTINSTTFRLGCNSAARLGTWTVTLTNAATGSKTDVKARYTFIYKLEGGKWKIDHLHSSAMPEKTG